jgi:transcriptional regulator with XRE-family HTH domain
MKKMRKNAAVQPVIDQIHFATQDRGWTLRDTAEELKISHVYLTALTSGARKLSGLSPDKQRALAKFLDISMLDFFLMAGILRQEDLVRRAAL